MHLPSSAVFIWNKVMIYQPPSSSHHFGCLTHRPQGTLMSSVRATLHQGSHQLGERQCGQEATLLSQQFSVLSAACNPPTYPAGCTERHFKWSVANFFLTQDVGSFAQEEGTMAQDGPCMQRECGKDAFWLPKFPAPSAGKTLGAALTPSFLPAHLPGCSLISYL